MTKYYDPPAGWRYGFPKEYNPSNPLETVASTLRRDGYPQELLEQGMDKYTRFWESEEEDSS